MSGWRRNWKRVQKAKKECKHSTSVAVTHQRETCTSDLTAPEPLSIHLHSHNLTDSHWALYLLEVKKMALSFGVENSHFLPVKQCQPLYTEPRVPGLCKFRLGAYDFLYDTNTEVTLPGLQKKSQSCCFPRVQKQDLCVQTRTFTTCFVFF